MTATTREPARTWVSRRMWSWPIMPTPITPMWTVMVLLLFWGCGGRAAPVVGSCRVVPGSAADADAAQVVAGTPGDRLGPVELDGVHVLLDDDEELRVELTERVDHGRDVR